MFYPPETAKLSFRQPLFDQMDKSPYWVAEPILKGIRCLAHHHHKRIDLWTRRRSKISAPLVELRRQIKGMIPDQTILDGVLIGTTTLKERYCIFDIPSHPERLFERYAALIDLYNDQPLIEIVRQTVNKRALFYKNKPFGIILKDLSSYYLVDNQRPKINPSWIKIIS